MGCRRKRLLFLLMTCVTIGGILAGAAGCGGTGANTTGNTTATATSTATTAEAAVVTSMDVRAQMRSLWMYQGWYTREVVLAVNFGSANLPASLDRLQRNQDDIGAALGQVYGNDAGGRIASLLHDRVNITVDAVNATKSGDAAKLTDANARWRQNAASIATAMSQLNPNWPYDQVLNNLSQQTSLLTDMVNAVAAGQWDSASSPNAITTNDAYINQSMKMADFLTTGITNQFPDRFPWQGTPAALSTITGTSTGSSGTAGGNSAATGAAAVAPGWPPGDDADDLRTMMRQVWMDHGWYMREVVMAESFGTANLSASMARLQKNQDDIGATFGLFYGVDSGNQLAALLHEHISIADEAVRAAKAGDTAGFDDASNRERQNAAAISGFLTAANPDWPADMMGNYLDQHLTLLTDMVNAALGGRWDPAAAPNAITTNDIYINEAMMMADFFTAGIRQQFPNQVTGSAGSVNTATPPVGSGTTTAPQPGN